MPRISFVHVADTHLGYAQYGLETRREDFSRAFEEVIKKTIELNASFMLIAGDFFHEARPANPTLAEAVHSLRLLKERGIKVLTVDGSHDSSPNRATGTILSPLDKAGLICYLPMREKACWENDNVYVYGVPSLTPRARATESVSRILSEKKPSPKPDKFNVFAFHGSVGIPEVTDYVFRPDLSVDEVPDGFNYYAGGHIHAPINVSFKSGKLVYAGCTETTSYEEAGVEKGFFYVEVDGGEVKVERIKLEGTRKFKVVKRDFSGKLADAITKEAEKLVMENDEQDAILILFLEGTLPKEVRRSSIDVARIRSFARKALHLHVMNKLKESALAEEIAYAIFKPEKDLRSKAYEYFLQVFSERYDRGLAEKYAKVATDLVPFLLDKRETKVIELLEGLA
jgi:DNA repair exonuclease SbcCD nuclease subunit